MKKQTNEIEGQECPSERARAQLHRALRLLSGKWKGEILWQLVDGKLRFGQLRRAIPDVTQHMLTTQLRDLESEGLVKRTVFPEVPPRVEYEMTPAARALTARVRRAVPLGQCTRQAGARCGRCQQRG